MAALAMDRTDHMMHHMRIIVHRTMTWVDPERGTLHSSLSLVNLQGCLYSRNGMVEWNDGMEQWNGME